MPRHHDFPPIPAVPIERPTTPDRTEYLEASIGRLLARKSINEILTSMRGVTRQFPFEPLEWPGVIYLPGQLVAKFTKDGKQGGPNLPQLSPIDNINSLIDGLIGKADTADKFGVTLDAGMAKQAILNVGLQEIKASGRKHHTLLRAFLRDIPLPDSHNGLLHIERNVACNAVDPIHLPPKQVAPENETFPVVLGTFRSVQQEDREERQKLDEILFMTRDDWPKHVSLLPISYVKMDFISPKKT